MAALIELSSELDSLDSTNSYSCEPDMCSSFLEISSENSITVLQLNICSVRKNHDELRILLSQIKVSCDVIVLTECWLQKCPNIPPLEGYTFYTTTNPLNQNAGVIIYIKSSIPHSITEPNFKYADCLTCTIENKMAIVGIYRSPSYNKKDQFDGFLNSLNDLLYKLKSFNNITIVGDLNVDIKPYNVDSFSNDYLILNATHALSPTHVFPTRGDKCYDHVLLKTKLPSTTLVIDSPITDHKPTLLCLKLKNKICNEDTRRKTTIDMENVNRDISDTDFSHILLIEDANLAADSLVSTLSSIISKHTKSILVSNKNAILKPWITPGLLRCIRNRDRLHIKSKKSPYNQIIKTTYIRYRNFCNCLLRKLKILHEKNELLKNKNNLKATWNTIKKITNTEKPRLPPLELLKQSCDPQSSLNSLNEYFINIGKTLATKIPPSNRDLTPFLKEQPIMNSMVLFDTDHAEIENIIINLRSGSAVGWDGISSSILKSNRQFLVPVITHICNIAFHSGIFPNAYKKALLHPIFKSGDKSNSANYRPISVLSTLSKIMEKLLNKRLMQFLIKNDILSDHQYGFRTNLSTEDAVIDLTTHITNKLDQGQKCMGIFLDLQKAFDTVDIPILLSKLHSLGIRGITHDIFRDYLSNRRQSVIINGSVSDEKTIEYGVPQGSIIGPTLFLIYINQLCNINLPNCKIFTYADDTALVIHGSDWSEIKSTAEHNLMIVNSWLSQNLLSLNLTKTSLIPFTIRNNTQPPSNYKICIHSNNCTQNNNCRCLPITQVPSIKYLGVHIDCNLNWHHHIDALTTRVRRLIHVFRSLRQSADLETLNLVYSALCLSVLAYCITAWGCATKSHFIRVERAQRAVLKVMYSKPIRFPTFQLYALASVLTVRQLFVLRTILRIHTKVPLPDPMKRKTYRKCPVPRHRTAFASRQFRISSLIIYNKINKSLNILKCNKYEVKRKLTDWLLQQKYDDTENLLPSRI